MPALWDPVMGQQTHLLLCADCGYQALTAGTWQTLWFRAAWWVLELQRVLGLGSYVTAWTWAQVPPRMVRPGRNRLVGRVEVDETYVGGVEEGVRGREIVGKALVAVAAEEDGRGMGRIRLRRIVDASAAAWKPLSKKLSNLAASCTPTAGKAMRDWAPHEVTVLRGKRQSASKLLPRVHRVASLLKRWLLGTHQGAVSHEYLDYYLDERSASTGGPHGRAANFSIASSSRRSPPTLLPIRQWSRPPGPAPPPPRLVATGVN